LQELKGELNSGGLKGGQLFSDTFFCPEAAKELRPQLRPLFCPFLSCVLSVFFVPEQ